LLLLYAFPLFIVRFMLF